MTSWNAPARVAAALLVVLSAHTVLAQSSSLDPAVRAALDEGHQFRERLQLSSALDSDRKALKLAKGHCTECLREMSNLQLLMELPRDAASTAGQWATVAGTPVERAQAEYFQATALIFAYREKPKDALLTEADQALKHAATDDPSNPEIHLLDGRILAMLKRDSDAKNEFAACAANPAATPAECLRAKNFASDVSLARGEQAPSFKVTKLDGTTITLDSLAGKVVLLDFWATWCPACVKDLDYIQSLAESMDPDRFVLIGISDDSNEETWKHYVSKNRMIGQQVRDSDHKMADLFHVGVIPTYVVLDANGTVQLRAKGAEGDIKGKVKELLAKSATPAHTASATPVATGASAMAGGN